MLHPCPSHCNVRETRWLPIEFRSATCGRDRSSRRTQRISRATHGVEKRCRKTLVELLPQAAHMHVDDVGLWIEMVIPHLLEQHGTGDDVSGVAHQISNDSEK